MRVLNVRVLIVLLFLLGLGAAVGGGFFILGPDGHLFGMPLDMLKNTPFSTFLIPGILLFTFVGIYPLVVAYGLFARPSWSWPNVVNPFKKMCWYWAASLAAGVVVIIWICVQVTLLGAIAFLNVLYLVWGAAIILLTLSSSVRQSYIRKTY